MKQSSASCSHFSRSNLPTSQRRQVIPASRSFYRCLGTPVGIAAEICLQSEATPAALDLCSLSGAEGPSAVEARSFRTRINGR
jgi:hypothetical protein